MYPFLIINPFGFPLIFVGPLILKKGSFPNDFIIEILISFSTEFSLFLANCIAIFMLFELIPKLSGFFSIHILSG